MNKKLLYKTRRIYLIFLIVIFLVVAPLFYILSQKIYLKNTDETLMLYKTEFIKNSASTLTENDINVWNRFNARIQIKKTNCRQTLYVFRYYQFVGIRRFNSEHRFAFFCNHTISISWSLYYYPKIVGDFMATVL